MSKSIKFFALAALTSASVFANAYAGELYPGASFDHVGTSKTRAEVQAETQAALAAGQIVRGEQSFVAASPSTRSRAEVQMEAAHAKHSDNPYLAYQIA